MHRQAITALIFALIGIIAWQAHYAGQVPRVPSVKSFSCKCAGLPTKQINVLAAKALRGYPMPDAVLYDFPLRDCVAQRAWEMRMAKKDVWWDFFCVEVH